MKVYVWRVDREGLKLSPQKPVVKTDSDVGPYYHSPQAVWLCVRWTRKVFGSIRQRDGVRVFNITVKEEK